MKLIRIFKEVNILVTCAHEIRNVGHVEVG